ncbi:MULTISPECIES: photosystem II protein Psb27 [Cyanobium]|jgi:photosystem II Psb27 protein|uniref:Photosystem II lipoprotein Psb27 n=2 Tax=Cyanobium TaxID=167375 RepID=A0A2P7MXG1_9CYAN|nr:MULTISPECIES: photosystem II protein Psb27 [Cyanobium]MDH4405856.1 photosystem II protein Psb27 [Cyanobium sp. D14.bin.5]MCP9780316.1 photosystem II protein Psb27 [Cyanobium sp. To12R1]MCP9782320.1 photosystem II protein Psb27 [Cyanobium sp. WKJ7-Wakatipu]MCP9878517.1 photosystem II protein Psb27 [Cyanobium sp. A1C-AMD]MCP9903999.1 photosystem II protein Psb27 [Cyanobium sp. BA5m-10]
MAAVLPSFRQRLKQLFSRLAVALVLCLSLALTACSSANTGLSGNYIEDTVAVADSLLSTIALGADDPARAEAEIEARSLSNGYVARYRPRSSVNGLGSFTTMQTAINSMAGHYTNYPNRPLPEALKERIAKELKKAETNATRGA